MIKHLEKYLKNSGCNINLKKSELATRNFQYNIIEEDIKPWNGNFNFTYWGLIKNGINQNILTKLNTSLSKNFLRKISYMHLQVKDVFSDELNSRHRLTKFIND